MISIELSIFQSVLQFHPMTRSEFIYFHQIQQLKKLKSLVGL